MTTTMNKQVRFEDNLFILMIRLRMNRDVITLNADPELFLEKTLDDICFIDHVLRNLLEYLQESSRLIEREEFIEYFSDAERQFSRIIKDILDHDGNLSIQEIPSLREKLEAFRNSSEERQNIAESLNPAEDDRGAEPVVSSDELTELLKAF